MTPIEWRRALRTHPDLNAHGWAVGCAVVEFWSPGNPVPHPGVDALAGITRLNRKTVLRGVANLEACGLLIVDRKRGRASRYHLTNQSLSGTNPVRHADQSLSGTSPPQGLDQSATRTKAVPGADQSATRTSPSQGQGCPSQGLAVVPGADQSGPSQGPEEETIEEDQEEEERSSSSGSSYVTPKPIPADFALPDVAITELAERTKQPKPVIVAAVREFRDYWTVGAGGFKARTNWAGKCRNDVLHKHRSGQLAEIAEQLAGRSRGSKRRQPEHKQPGATGSAFDDIPPEFN